MSVKTRDTLYTYFLQGLTPSESNFADLLDSSTLAEDIVTDFTSTANTKVMAASGGKILNDSLVALTSRVVVLEGAESTFLANYYTRTATDALLVGVDSAINALPYASEIIALDAKISTNATAITGKAPSSHTHLIANVTDLQSELDLKASELYVLQVKADLVTAINAIPTGSDESADIVALQSTLTALQSTVSQLPTSALVESKANVSHDHTASNITDLAASYYNKSQTDALLSDGLPTEAHTHQEAGITDLDKYTKAQTELKISDHSGLTNNPHGVTGVQVGLGNVENKSVVQIFSSTEAQDFANTLPGGSTHMSDATNPHSVTKSQVGLASVPNVDVESLLNVHLAASNPHSIDLSFFDVFSQAETDTRILFHIDAARYAFTPTSGTDSAGAVGDIAYDNASIHVKVAAAQWLTFVISYTKAESDALYEPIDTAYTKAESDANYEPLDSAYTKAESDANYEPIDTAYTKAESDANYEPIDTAYTKAESDANDQALQVNIDAEETARNAAISATNDASTLADQALQVNIDTEETARIAGDSNLSASINAVQAQHSSDINAHIAATNPHTVTASDVGAYTESEADTLLDLKANALDVYTQTEVSAFINSAITSAHTTVYSKTEVDTAVALKADQSTTYTKTETDTAITTAAGAGLTQMQVIQWIMAAQSGTLVTNQYALPASGTLNYSLASAAQVANGMDADDDYAHAV